MNFVTTYNPFYQHEYFKMFMFLKEYLELAIYLQFKILYNIQAKIQMQMKRNVV